MAAFVVAHPGASQQPSADASPIQRMAATERAFAAAAAEIGVRDSFLTFFADDAVSLTPGADGVSATLPPAKTGLTAQLSPPLPLVNKLMWAPFTGQASRDGTIGWLTGAYVAFNEVAKLPTATGAYFSVWKRQNNGTWRVWLDYGISLPSLWNDAAPFRAAAEPDSGDAGAPTDTLAQVEQAVAHGGTPWRDRLAATVRLHRDGQLPFADRDVAAGWAASAWRSVTYHVIKTEAAGSDDLGVTLGGYDATAADGSAEHGVWVRVWRRDVTGRWRIMFETSKKG